MKKLGVIGGLGPMASAYFLELITEMCDAASDQEHIETVVYSKPSTPDRTAYILDKSQESPVPAMVQSGAVLKAMGVDILAIPCVTAHYFHAELESLIGMRIVNAVRETAEYLNNMHIDKVAIMATDGTVKSGLFQSELEKRNIGCILPDEEEQKGVMRLIYECVKAGQPIDMDLFNSIKESLKTKGAQVIILGCTELSIIKKNNNIGAGFLDVLEVLANKCVSECAKLKPEYNNLITK